MTRDQAIALLPCYAAGDLPPPVALEVEQVARQHPDLSERIETLRELQERVARAICDAAPPPALNRTWVVDDPPVVPIDLPGRPLPAAERPTLPIAILAVAAALALMIGLVWSLGPRGGPTASLPSVVYAHQTTTSGRLQAVAPSDTDALARAFAAAGVPARLRGVEDLTHLGLTAESVYIIPGQPPAAAVAYQGATQRYLHQSWLGVGASPRPATTRSVGDVTLSGYLVDGVALVMWSDDGVLQVMSASVPLDDLLDLVQRRLVAGT